jgi:hypothetical protein
MFDRCIGNTKNVREKILKEGFIYKRKIKNWFPRYRAIVSRGIK